jgi:O-acetylserine/cysteine efflux transporter
MARVRAAALSSLRPAHMALALLIVAIWGTNFVVIKVGLRDFEPFHFALMRFAFCAVPFIFFIRRPEVPWRWLVLYGVLLGAGQFGLLYYAMHADISPGLASLVIQTQVPFTIVLSVLAFHEKVGRTAIVGTLLAAAGLGLIGWHLDATVTARGVALVLGAALCWACANIIVKKASLESGHKIDMLGFIVWSSVFAVPPLLLMTLAFEGAGRTLQALSAAHLDAWGAMAWQAIGNMLFAFAAWSWLLTRYDAAVISPYALLVPVFGMGSSAILLGEPLPAWKFYAAALVLGGIALITLAPLLRRRIA